MQAKREAVLARWEAEMRRLGLPSKTRKQTAIVLRMTEAQLDAALKFGA